MPGDFASPEARILVDGQVIPVELGARVRFAEIDLVLNAPGRYRLLISDPGFAWYDSDLLDFGREVRIELGFTGQKAMVITGRIHQRNIDMRRSGAPELEVVGADPMFRMGRVRTTRTFLDMTSSDVIRKLASDHGISVQCADSGIQEAYFLQDNRSDLEYLLDLAAQSHFDCHYHEGTLYVERPDYGRPSIATLTWEKTLLAFRPRFSTATAASKVVVRGWDPKAKKAVTVEVTRDDAKARGKSLVDMCGSQAQGEQVSAEVTSAREAERLAQSIMAQGAAGGLTALCESRGDPLIRPAAMVDLEGVGRRLSGSYMVTQARHRFGTDGYLTFFTVRRNAFEEPAEPRESETSPGEDESVDIEVEVLDALGELLPDAEYVISLSDGSQRQGRTGSDGKLSEAAVPKGPYRIEITDFEVTVTGRA